MTMANKPRIVNLSERRQKLYRKRIDERIKTLLDNQFEDGGSLTGFALVVWGADGTSCADMMSSGGVTPEIMIPDFVRNRLLAEKIEHWTIDSVNRSQGLEE